MDASILVLSFENVQKFVVMHRHMMIYVSNVFQEDKKLSLGFLLHGGENAPEL